MNGKWRTKQTMCLHWTQYSGGGGLVTKLCLTLVTPETVVCQAPLSMGFSRQEQWGHWSHGSSGTDHVFIRQWSVTDRRWSWDCARTDHVAIMCICTTDFYPFICWWTSRLLPCPGYYKRCCDEHWGTRVSFPSGFLSVCPAVGLLDHKAVLFPVF